MENSQHTDREAAEWKRLRHECVIDREESRLNLLIQLREFIGCFSSWSGMDYPKHPNRIRATQEALWLVVAALEGDDETMRKHLEQIAFEFRCRVKEGRFDD